jgi:hypothetical protein
VLWIGGPPGAGKTTLALRLVRRHGLRWYGSDTRTWAHRDRALADRNEAALRWEALSPEARRKLEPDEAIRLWLHAERGQMIVDDLLRLGRSPLVVAEGSPVPAWAVSTGIAERERALWLLPRAELLLAETIEREARAHDVPILEVDSSMTIDETVAFAEARFAAALAEGPCAATAEERRSLLREANEAVVAQVRGYFARPWAEGDAEENVRSFVCECGATDCVESVDLPVGAAAAAPVLASSHAGAER